MWLCGWVGGWRGGGASAMRRPRRNEVCGGWCACVCVCEGVSVRACVY